MGSVFQATAVRAIALSTVASGFLVPLVLQLSAQPIRAQVFEGTQGCPGGTQEGGRNFVINGTFSRNAGTGDGVATAPAAVPPSLGFSSDLPYRGDSVYPNDPIGGLSIQGGPYPIVYAGGVVTANPFPGDPLNRVPPSNTFLYSNPAQNVAGGSAFPDPLIWQQVVNGLVPNVAYNFSAYFYNLLSIGTLGAPPVIRYLAGPPNGPEAAFVPNLAGITVTTPQQWTRVQGLFRTTPDQAALELRIIDEANTVFGDDFGFTAAGLRECVPNLGIAKQAGNPQENPDGTFSIPYTLVVQNFAPATASNQYAIRNLQLQDNLAIAFTGVTVNAIRNLRSPTLTVNPGFNGTTDQNVLVGTDTLAGETSATVSFEVIITPGDGAENLGPFQNTAIATGLSPGGEPISDRSTDGTNPDLNGDRNPGGAGEDLPTSVSLRPARLRLAKRITNVLRGGVSLSGVNFGALVITSADDTAPGWSQLVPQGAPVGAASLSSSNPLQPGDEVEYTVYFLSDGRTDINAVNLCDQIPPGTRFIFGTNRVRIGSQPLAIAGEFFTPLAPLPANNPCSDQNNPNGSLIFNLGNLPNSPSNNVGYAQFRVKIE
ncbi:hypothetical protein JOY44_05265 [Phormidium sp. CLA17]|uniref:hypothetical protein n=1 Tax=Leptolyngbya sp. Cla-17 TaxID=2803751 RepID=UPI00149120A8|nr:hypothetical protein [Leptolyngbya sp. Cla-17]MBM0741031.1 hypothetical protein [Leptolyngbya sp. Cla-17]